MLKENEPHWFLMRLRNSKVVSVEEMQRRLEAHVDVLETYAPLRFIKVCPTKMDFASPWLNYIFVRSTFEKLLKLKRNEELFASLHFVMHPDYDEDFVCRPEVFYISDKRMEDYMRVTREEDRKVIFLTNMDYVCRPSQEVQITEGRFAGVMGRIKRVGGNRCVVIPIGREMAVGVMDVPRCHLRYLSEEEAMKMEDM